MAFSLGHKCSRSPDARLVQSLLLDVPDAAVGAGVAGGAAGLAAALSAGAALALSPLPPSPARLRFLSPSFLKSVSYQPLPANRNDGALTIRRKCGASQAGHTVGSVSDNFCSRSKRWPQPLHSNS